MSATVHVTAGLVPLKVHVTVPSVAVPEPCVGAELAEDAPVVPPTVASYMLPELPTIVPVA